MYNFFAFVSAKTRIRDTHQIVGKTTAPVPKRYSICGEPVTRMQIGSTQAVIVRVPRNPSMTIRNSTGECRRDCKFVPAEP